jgi:ectoine hydroxylase-related dioxygenase (phytanoyl-CoA dioxygenase family)
MSNVKIAEKPLRVTESQKRDYEEKGYFVLERAIPQEHLQILRDECQGFIDKIDAQMDAAHTDVIGPNHRAKRYFIGNRYKEGKRLHEFLFSDLIADICRATIGNDAYLFFEQYVVKGAEKGMKFDWHQDSGYVNVPHRPYVSCWCALDDVNEANGTVYMLPYDRAGTRDLVEHKVQPGTNDKVGYFGDDPGDAVLCPAGSIAVFSSTCFHRSGFNTTPRMRRAYLAQYSPEPILNKEKTAPFGQVEPFLKAGKKLI